MRPRHITTHVRSLGGPNYPTLRHCKPGSRALPWHEDPIPSRQHRTGQLQPSRHQRSAFHRRYQVAIPGNFKVNTSVHGKPRFQRTSTTSPYRTPTTTSQPANNKTSPTDYPPPRGVLWKRISAMVRSDTSCLVCHFNKPNEFLRLKFHQEFGCSALEKHGYIFQKYVTASATIFDKFNKKIPRMPDQPLQPGARKASEDTGL